MIEEKILLERCINEARKIEEYYEKIRNLQKIMQEHEKQLSDGLKQLSDKRFQEFCTRSGYLTQDQLRLLKDVRQNTRISNKTHL